MSEPPHRARLVLEEESRAVAGDVLVLGDLVLDAIRGARHALVDRDLEACVAVIEGDRRINDMQLRVRNQCFTVILTQAPVACDLRAVVGFLEMSSELERMGDHAVSIARVARRLLDHPAPHRLVDLPGMFDACLEQLIDILTAVENRDEEAARPIAWRDVAVDRMYHHTLDRLLEDMSTDARHLIIGTDLLLVAQHLERIADRVTNIAEELVFVASGETVELG